MQIGFEDVGMCDIYRLLLYRHCCFNDGWADIIKYVTHFAKNKQKTSVQKHSLRDEAYWNAVLKAKI